LAGLALSRLPAPTFADVTAAASRIGGVALETPLLRSPALDAASGGCILVKAETLQRTGAFKFRGAYNFLTQIPPARRARGVVACSSGNHGQAVAAAARLHGVPAVIVMPRDAPAIKKALTRAQGAEVILYDRGGEARETIAGPIALAERVMAQGRAGVNMARYKGLGEMNPDQLWETTLDPNARSLLLVRVAHADDAEDIFATLMGEVVEPRRDFIQSHALEVANLDV